MIAEETIKKPVLTDLSKRKIQYVVNLYLDGVKSRAICRSALVSRQYIADLLDKGRQNEYIPDVDYLTLRKQALSAKAKLLKMLGI